MATLSNPISKQNIVDRFADYVVADANASIVWHDGNNPQMDTAPTTTTRYLDVLPDSMLGPNANGQAIAINGSSITGSTITASTIRSILEAETARYSNIRKVRARGRVNGQGGNNGTRLRNTSRVTSRTYIQKYDSTQKSYMTSTYRQTLGSVNNGGVTSGGTIQTSDFETYFANLRTEYRRLRDVTYDRIYSVCHASCHSSCHSSRGRR